jgi:hypothetical protein
VQVLGRVLSIRERLPSSIARLGLLCLFIVVVGMIRPRLTQDAAGWLLLACGLVTLAGAGAFFMATRRAAAHLPLMAGSLRIAEAILVLIRRTGLPLLALAFFLFWTFVYLGLWWFRPDGSFAGIGAGENPRFADFFYYSVMTALTSPPEGIVPLSRGTRSATMIEILTGLALLTTYVTSLFASRGQRPAPPDGDAGEPGA